ncbi:MAG: hypothetical protein ACLVJ6_06370 [Merdibacter sp.]
MCADCQRRYEQNPLRILDCKIDRERAIMKSAPKMSDYLNDDPGHTFRPCWTDWTPSAFHMRSTTVSFAVWITTRIPSLRCFRQQGDGRTVHGLCRRTL